MNSHLKEFHKPMKTTALQKNVLRILKKAIDRAMAYACHRAKRRPLKPTHQYFHGTDIGRLDSLFAKLSTFKRLRPNASPLEVREYIKKADGGTIGILDACVLQLYNMDADAFQADIYRFLLKDLQQNAAAYELLSQMPPPRRERIKREPQTPIQRRAATVDGKVRQWERKLRYAKTKLAAYRKKQKYYTKKGVTA